MTNAASDKRTIVKNAGFLMASQIATWMLTLLLTVFLPRYLGAAAIGKFHLANSTWAIAGILISFGMDTLLTKEIARRPDETTELLGTSLLLRALLYLPALAGMIGYLALFRYPADTALVVYIIGAAALIQQFGGAVQASLQGLERMDRLALANVASKATTTAGSLLMLALGQGIYAVAGVSVISAVVYLTLQLWFVRQHYAIELRWNLSDATRMLRNGLPYMASQAFLILYQQVDIVTISLLVDDRTVGWYGAADQLFGTLLFVPTVFITAVFPSLARSFAERPEDLPKLMSRSFGMLLLISVPVGLGIMVLADATVVLLFGDGFAGSGPVLSVMGIVLLLTYQNMLLGRFLIATDRQNVWTGITAAITLASIPLDLVLIPWCQRAFGNGAIGGALKFVITELAMLVVGLRLLPKGSLGKADAWLAIRCLIAGGLMALVTWPFRDAFVAIPLALGVTAYVVVALALGLVRRDEIAAFSQAARRTVMRRLGHSEAA